MTGLQFQTAFQREINQLDESPEFNTRDIIYWLNKGIFKFVKTRYSGINPKQDGFEQTQKRIDDLRNLLVDADLIEVDDDYIDSLPVADKITLATSYPNSVEYLLPTDYFLTVSEQPVISFTNLLGQTINKYTSITECTQDTYSNHFTDPYSEHILHHQSANPLRLFFQDRIVAITDGNYTMENYYLRYIKLPTQLVLDPNDLASWRSVHYIDLPEHTHKEIVSLAVSAALENLGNPRYQSQMNEVVTME